MVLDDAVVHDRDFIIGKVRMCVLFVRCSMRRPACMSDAQRTIQRRCIQHIRERLYFADRALACKTPIASEHRYSG